MADLKMYLTSLEPNMSQTILSQSIGGYISNTLLYPETTVDSIIGLYDTAISLGIPSTGNWSEWEGVTYISINDELMQVNSVDNSITSVVQRGVNGKVKVHIKNDIARGVSEKELFNDVFNDSYKQYRCIAVKNNSSAADPSNEVTANNISVYLGDNSRNLNSNIKISIEAPKSQYISGVATSIILDSSSGTSSLVDTSLSGTYANGLFNNAYLKINSGTNAGQGRVVQSFSSSGIFYFGSALTSDTSVSYEVLPSPAQRVKSGMMSPSVSTFVANSVSSPLFVNLFIGENISFDQGALGINDVFYIWLERTINKGSPVFENNSALINIQYDSVIG